MIILHVLDTTIYSAWFPALYFLEKKFDQKGFLITSEEGLQGGLL